MYINFYSASSKNRNQLFPARLASFLFPPFQPYLPGYGCYLQIEKWEDEDEGVESYGF
jgi:hypothetical protein